MRTTVKVLIVGSVMAMLAAIASAGSIEMKVPFELDEWVEVEETDADVTVHRVRLARKEGNLKSKLFRPGNSEYLESVQIQIEFTNNTDRDREARLEIHWLDVEGRIIDGYNDDEDLDEDERRELATVLLSTLAYGLEVAETLDIKIDF